MIRDGAGTGRTRRGIRSSAGLVVALVSLVTFIAAAVALDPGDRSGDAFVREVGGWFAVGMLVLASSFGARASVRMVRTGRSGMSEVARSLLTIAAAVGRQLVLSLILLLPVLAAGWELGASVSTSSGVLVGICATVVFGASLGILFGCSGLSFPVGTLLASSATVLMLWPRTLNWSTAMDHRFPGPESSMIFLGSILLVILVGSGAMIARRSERGARR